MQLLVVREVAHDPLLDWAGIAAFFSDCLKLFEEVIELSELPSDEPARQSVAFLTADDPVVGCEERDRHQPQGEYEEGTHQSITLADRNLPEDVDGHKIVCVEQDGGVESQHRSG